jgi:hypothetical protein
MLDSFDDWLSVEVGVAAGQGAGRMAPRPDSPHNGSSSFSLRAQGAPQRDDSRDGAQSSSAATETADNATDIATASSVPALPSPLIPQ